MLATNQNSSGWVRKVAAGLCFGLAFCVALSARLLADEPITAPPSKAQIDRWVADLESPKFIIREVAVEKLLSCGAAAVEPVAAVLEQGDLEVVTRGVRILRELAVCGDEPTEHAAIDALSKLSEVSGTVASRRASETLASIDQLRQMRAVAELKKLGAIIRADSIRFGLAAPQVQLETMLTIELSDSWQGGEKGLMHLRWLQEVQQVILQGQKVDAAWLPYLQRMPNLKVVQIKRCRLTDADIEKLTPLKDLRLLGIFYTSITDKSIPALLKMQGVGDLRLIGTDISQDGANQLQAALTVTSVDYRRGAFVGVGCDPTANNCFVTHVQPGSAAEKAGLEVGDEIISYGGKKVTDFNSLRELIQKNKAGDSIAIEINRDSETLTKELKLGEWD